MRPRRTYVDGRWGQVHVRTAGEGRPLVLLHQSPLSGAMFEPATPYLVAAGFHVFAPDTPGFGLSDPPPAPPTLEEQADALVATLDALGLERPHVLGHHTGAAIAALLAATRPDRIDRLALNGVPWLTPEELAHFRTFRFVPLEPLPDGSHLTAAWEQRLRATPGWTDLRAMHRHVVEQLANPDRFHWGFHTVLSADLGPYLGAITAPTLVLTNTGEDLYEASRRVAVARPDWAFHALEGGTHDIVDEQPQAWATAVVDFLNGEPRG